MKKEKTQKNHHNRTEKTGDNRSQRKRSRKTGGGDLLGRSPLRSSAMRGFVPCSIRPLFGAEDLASDNLTQ